MNRVKVTCLSCGQDDLLTIDDRLHAVVDYEKKVRTPFAGFRWRPDLQWGFRCHCGNYSLLAPQEESDFDKLVDGDPLTLERIADQLKIPAENKFRMETV